MRKLISTMFILFISFMAYSIEDITIPEEQLGEPMGWMIGGGGGYNENILKTDKNSIDFLPMVRYEGEKYFVGPGVTPHSILSVGGYIYRDDTIKLSAFYNPMAGFDIKRSDLDKGYENLDKRKMKNEVGVKIEKEWQELNLKGYTTYGENGSVFGGEVSKKIHLSEKLFLTSSIEFVYYTSKYTDYYFGISNDEVIRNSKIKSSYNAGGAYTYGAGLDLTYNLDEKTMLGASIGIIKYSKEVEDSPIVDRSTAFSAGVMVMYFIY